MCINAGTSYFKCPSSKDKVRDLLMLAVPRRPSSQHDLIHKTRSDPKVNRPSVCTYPGRAHRCVPSGFCRKTRRLQSTDGAPLLSKGPYVSLDDEDSRNCGSWVGSCPHTTRCPRYIEFAKAVGGVQVRVFVKYRKHAVQC